MNSSQYEKKFKLGLKGTCESYETVPNEKKKNNNKDV
jgi:hypothetical protein